MIDNTCTAAIWVDLLMNPKTAQAFDVCKTDTVIHTHKEV